MFSMQEENEAQSVILVGPHNSFLGWNMFFGSCSKCPFQGDTYTAYQESCRCLLGLGTTKAMETVGFLHLFTQSRNELEEKAICPLAFLNLEQWIKRGGYFIPLRIFIKLAEALTKMVSHKSSSLSKEDFTGFHSKQHCYFSSLCPIHCFVPPTSP